MASGLTRFDRRSFVKAVAAGVLAGAGVPAIPRAGSGEKARQAKWQLSKEHLAAVNRQRRVVVNYDTGFGAPSPVSGQIQEGNPSRLCAFPGWYSAWEWSSWPQVIATVD